MRPKEASTGSPRGPSTVTVTRSPPWAATSASTVPSPPSATGTSSTSASLQTRRTPRLMAAAASGALRLPLYGLGAATTLISGHSCKASTPAAGAPGDRARLGTTCDSHNSLVLGIIFGPPGSGKGTQAQRITDALGTVHISDRKRTRLT